MMSSSLIAIFNETKSSAGGWKLFANRASKVSRDDDRLRAAEGNVLLYEGR